MNVIRDLISERIVNPTVQRNKQKYVICEVTSSNEAENSCEIEFINGIGKKEILKNVQVRLYGNGTEWFPAVGDKAIAEIYSSSPIIIARHIGNYNMDVRSQMELKQDALSDYNACLEAGGEIM